MNQSLRIPGVALAAGLTLSAGLVTAQRLARRATGEPVATASLRTAAGLAPGESLLFNGWGLTPAGHHVRLNGDMPLKMVVSPDGTTLAVVTGGFNNTGLELLDLGGRTSTQFLPLARAFNGLAFSGDGKQLFVTGGASGEVHAFDLANGRAGAGRHAVPGDGGSAAAEGKGNAGTAGDAGGAVFLAGIAVHPRTGRLYVCNEASHEIWVVDPASLRLEARIPAGLHPHSAAFGADRRHLYVSNWGSRSVSVIDTERNRRIRDISVGIRPNDMALAPDGRLFVACSGDNTVYVIQTRALETPEAPASPARRLPEGTREVLSTSLYPQSPEGSTPDGVAVSPDGKSLYVANADNNDVMVADISDPAVTRVNGFVPVGWYPTAVAVAPDGTLLVGNGKGLRFRANYPARLPKPQRLHKPPAFDYIGRALEGSVSFVARPEGTKLAEWTEQARRNSPYTPAMFQHAPVASDSVIPDRVGEPCPIKHVLFVIKENRTYDQQFGDFKDARGQKAGNGDERLTLFGESVTPNQHALARDYVLLDNLYCNGEVSVDGHSWCDGAIASDWNERSWLVSYSRHGSLPGNEETETPAAGYLWDLCRRHGVSFRCYGEGAAQVPNVNRGTWPGGRDPQKVDGWIRDLHAAERTGELPRFMIMSLGENHTQGTKPGAPTPDACVASNDVAVGRLVEAATRSRFWKEMAIFVIEDDTQNGPDHVDAHRTPGLVISPYVRRGIVDSTLYTTASMVRTIELILGLPPLTQYDAGATPMFHCFQRRAVQTVFQPRQPDVDLSAKNPAAAPGARESLGMDFREYDRAPEDALNRILWRAAKGPGVPYPAPVHRALLTVRGR